MYLIDEAVNNILHHSGEESGFIMAQIYKESKDSINKYLDISIADVGFTLLENYKSSDKYSHILSHKEAIECGIEGKSTKSNNIDRGFGISTSKKMLVKGLGGKYLLFSGNAINIHTSEKNEIIELENVFWQGAYVVLRIPLQYLGDFIASDYYE
jgi:hypothetical protein